MNKPNNNLQDDNLQGHNAELINSKFSDTLNENGGDAEIKSESENIIPNTQKKESQK